MIAITANDASPDKQSNYDTYDVNAKPPPFGHAIKPYWAFDPGYTNLNHGSYGSVPLPVLFKCAELTMLSERKPDLFHRITYMPLLREARKRVADLIGADHDEVVLVPNATHAINTVLRNFEWQEGDVLMGASTTYGAVSRTIQYISDRSEPPRPTAHTVTYTFPMTHVEIVEAFRTRIKEIKSLYPNTEFSDVPPDSVPSGTYTAKKNKFVAVIDTLVSNPGVLLPWKQLVQICKEEGVWSVVDGAHSVGQEMDMNVGQAKPDFLISNCHKWLYAKRGCALLYVPYRNQYLIKSSIPTSHSYISPSDIPPVEGTNFVQQHEWTGTADQTPFLSISAALDFRQWLGGEAKINNYCHQLAMKGGKRLAEVMQTKVIDETGELTLNMTNVLLPLPVETTKGEIYTSATLNEINTMFRERLLYDYNAYAGHYFHAGGWWCRCSAQVWNEISDFEYIGSAFSAICKEIKDTILSKGKENSTAGSDRPLPR
ncbi:PLP-dependent transferase [Wolfiporia cocos MD-104 SS10]|uniref:PLP-dependent transferase n=1 Tax=Wolfiporia cocos (strain MD-104) TaxID=742152 RepID=A0A2H3JL10_WOLCO|nr:PLP-dependent transferase [Wolfiporia cocos MD-104 SS10]